MFFFFYLRFILWEEERVRGKERKRKKKSKIWVLVSIFPAKKVAEKVDLEKKCNEEDQKNKEIWLENIFKSKI